MSRLPPLAPADLSDGQRRVYDAIAGGRRAQGPRAFGLTDENGALVGPFNAFLLQPRLGMALQELGSAVRFETALTDRAREIAILLVAAQWDSAFERHAHEALGRSIGMTDEELRSLRERRVEHFVDPYERTVAETVLRLCGGGDLDDDSYESVVAQLGAPAIFELTTLVGYYATLALQLRVFRVGVS